MLDRAIVKVLSLPIINKPVVYMWHLYHIAQLNKVKNQNFNNLLKSIDHHKLDITSDFARHDAKALESVVQRALRDNIVVAEIGSWKGMSTSIIAKTIKPFNGKLFAIDHWQGSNGVPEHKQAETVDMFSLFRHNMETLELLDIIHPMVMDSVTASTVFPNDSLDLVFIDADHRYSNIMADLEVWYPKVKPRGIICGHDCEEKYTKFGNFTKEIDKRLEEDAIIGICHPGVVRALYDVFKDDYETVEDSSVWWKRK